VNQTNEAMMNFLKECEEQNKGKGECPLFSITSISSPSSMENRIDFSCEEVSDTTRYCTLAMMIGGLFLMAASILLYPTGTRSSSM
jgi:hypothetical protein